MILFAQLYLDFPPFYCQFEEGIIGDLVEVLGPLPGSWKGLCKYPGTQDSWYQQPPTPTSETSKELRTPEPRSTTDERPTHVQNGELRARIARRRPDVDQEERDLVESIMLKVFGLCPENRPSATQLLRDNDFQALMNKYGC